MTLKNSKQIPHTLESAMASKTIRSKYNESRAKYKYTFIEFCKKYTLGKGV